MNESKYSKLANILRGYVPNIHTIAIISAENPYGKESSDIFNKIQSKELEEDLKSMNLGYRKIKGKYGSYENSFLINNITLKETLNLGKKYNQETVIFGEKIFKSKETDDYIGMNFKMIYTTNDKFGEIVDEKNIFINLENPEDFYTEYKGKKFNIPFFDEDYDLAGWEEDSGVIKLNKIDEKNSKLLNNTVEQTLLDDRTEKSKWVDRGFIKNKIKKLKKQ